MVFHQSSAAVVRMEQLNARSVVRLPSLRSRHRTVAPLCTVRESQHARLARLTGMADISKYLGSSAPLESVPCKAGAEQKLAMTGLFASTLAM